MSSWTRPTATRPGERRDRDVGDVVGVDDRLAHFARRQGEHAVLHSPTRKCSLKFWAKKLHRTTSVSTPDSGGLLAALRLRLAAPREQDESVEAVLPGRGAERREDLERRRDREVGLVRDVGALDPSSAAAQVDSSFQSNASVVDRETTARPGRGRPAARRRAGRSCRDRR